MGLNCLKLTVSANAATRIAENQKWLKSIFSKAEPARHDNKNDLVAWTAASHPQHTNSKLAGRQK